MKLLVKLNTFDYKYVIMPRKPVVHFRLKPEDSTGLSIIYLQFIYQGRRLFYSFGQSIKTADWNEKKERVKNKQTTTADGKFALNCKSSA